MGVKGGKRNGGHLAIVRVSSKLEFSKLLLALQNMNGKKFVVFVAFICILEGSQNVASEAATSSFAVEQGDFSCGENLICSGNATTNEQGLLKLTPDPRPRDENYTYFLNTHGTALYNQSVPLLDQTTNRVASLNISFSFLIQTEERAGDGIAFVISGNKTWVGGSGGSFAVGPGIDALAVEFDTFANPGIDNDDNHVGIDTASTTSLRAWNVLFSLVGSRVYSWVDYDSLTSTLEVRVGRTSQKPEHPFISFTLDLLEVFGFKRVQDVWVGFSGANGFCKCFSYYTVYDLKLNSYFPPLSAPAPPTPSGSPAFVPPATPPPDPTRPSTGLIAGVTVGVAGVLLGGGLLFFCCWWMRSDAYEAPDDGSMAAYECQIAGLSSSLKMYSYDELRAATGDFSDTFKLGEGGFGSVYRGSIPATDPELLVAVKKVSRGSKQGEREFVAEVSTIGNFVRHRNIVQLLGWCYDHEGEGKYLLVYEFMPNGSLCSHLFPSSRTVSQQPGQESVHLSWEERYRILGGLAAALQYLHEGGRQQVIHRDVKSSNVMLDDNFNAMLGDFGLARMADHYENPATTIVAGTYGYIAPEASTTGKFTVKTDVYAFGAVCLETVCGKRPYRGNYTTDEDFLLDHVWRKLSAGELFSVVDTKLEGNYDSQQAEVVLLLGLLCSHPNPDKRPDMRRVVDILAGTVEMPPIPKNKPQAEYVDILAGTVEMPPIPKNKPEAEDFSYTSSEHRSRFSVPGSEADASENEHHGRLYSSRSNYTNTASNASVELIRFSGNTSGLSSVDTTSSRESCRPGDAESEESPITVRDVVERS